MERFSFGVAVVLGGGRGLGRTGTESERTASFSATTRSARAKSVLLRMLAKIGSNVVQ